MTAAAVLPPTWQVWVAGNLIRGRPSDELVRALVDEGYPEDAARGEVDALAASPGVVAARIALRPVVHAHRLRREHLRLGGPDVAVRRGRDAHALARDHVAAQVPVVLPELTDGWPARAWTWPALVARFGDRPVPVCDGRARVDRPARRWRALATERPFAEIVARALDPATGDDLYVTANNAALEGPDRRGGPLAELLDDVRPVEGVLPRERLRESSVWIGGAGTRTPVHHDVADILFCPFLGAKDVWLAPPEEIELADHAAGFFGPDLALGAPQTWAPFGLDGLAVRHVRVEPGEALLIPAGWWHEVRALAPCVTLTFAGLAHPNDYRWFRPALPDADPDDPDPDPDPDAP